MIREYPHPSDCKNPDVCGCHSEESSEQNSGSAGFKGGSFLNGFFNRRVEGVDRSHDIMSYKGFVPQFLHIFATDFGTVGLRGSKQKRLKGAKHEMMAIAIHPPFCWVM